MGNNDFWQSLIRRLVTLAAGALVSHGYFKAVSVDQEVIELVTGATMAIITTVWSTYHQVKMKGANEPKKVIGG